MKTHCQIRPRANNLLSIGVLLATALCFCAGDAKADGVILIKGNPTQSPQYWTPLAFLKIEGFSITYTVALTNGQQRNFRKDEVGAILEEPKWQEMTVVSDADWQNLEQQKTQLLSSAGQYPQLKDWANSIAAKFDAALARQFSGTVIYRGKVIAKSDYDKMRGMTVPDANSGAEKGVWPELVIGTVKLINAKLASFNESRVSIAHSGGIKGYNLADLREIEIASLSKAFPEFAAHVEQLKKQSSMQSSGITNAHSNDNETKKSSSSTPLAIASDQAAKRKATQIEIESLIKLINENFTFEPKLKSDSFPDELYIRTKKGLWQMARF